MDRGEREGASPERAATGSADPELRRVRDREDRSALFQAPIEALGPPDRVLAAHLVLLDGVPVGSWRRTLDAKRAKVDLRLGRDVPEEAMAEALAAFERFVALPLETRRVPTP